MKKSLIALAVLGFAGAAMAQSSVTLYGVADAGVGQIKSPALSNTSKVQMISGQAMNNGNSRFGLRGIEDLGGGLKVGFNFEDGLSLKDGHSGLSGGQFWSRQANVWVGSNFGQLVLGRTFNPSYDTLAVWELTGQANYSVVGNTFGYTGVGSRTSSQFKYVSPNFMGLKAEVSYVTKGDNFVNGKSRNKWDAGLSYVNGPIAIGASANQQKGDKTNYQVGGKYSFLGNFAVAASYNSVNSRDLNVLGGHNFRRRGFSLGGQYHTGPFVVTLDVTRDTKNDTLNSLGTGTRNKKYTNGVVEGKYALSKRTFVYAAYLRFDGDNNYGIGLRHNF